ncbi:MAG TPA: hypothetical protein DCO72_00980 [Ruminococcus sp.]|nr:hypothetical protein [Ruminococcus sp.]
MENRRYEFSTNNSSASYAWTEGTPDSVRRLQNPAMILGEHTSAYYIYHYRLYKITTSSGINATNRQSSASVVEDHTIDDSGAFTSVAYGEKLSALNQYLLNFIGGHSHFGSGGMSEESLKTVLNYIVKHLPSAIANDTIIDAEDLKFIRQPARLEHLSYIRNNLMLPDFTKDSGYDKLYTCLVNLTEKQSLKHLLFISDMYISDVSFLENRNLLDEYYYYLSLFSTKKGEKGTLAHDVYLFVCDKKDFCQSVIFHELENYETFIKNIDVVKSYFPEEMVIRALQALLEKSLGKQTQGSEYVNLIVQSVDTMIANQDELHLADREQLVKINFELTKYINRFSAKRQLPAPIPEQLTIVEYFLNALKGGNKKANLEYATYKEINFLAEYCHTNHIEMKTIKNALKSDIQANMDFLEYYESLYQKQGKPVKYTNNIPAELFVNGLISIPEFITCYGDKNFKKKWKEIDHQFLQQRYSKTNILSIKFLFKLWLSRRIYLWQSKERFLYLEDLNTEEKLQHSKKKGGRK